VDIIAGRLYWVCDSKPPQNYKEAFFFNIDNDLVYMPFNKDFGPLNLAMVHRYCRELAKLYKVHCQNNTRIFHYTGTDKAKMTNALFLMCAFMVVILKMSAEEAYHRF
jgi:cell division cycle 14